MLLKSLVMSCRAARKTLASLAGGYAARAKGYVAPTRVSATHISATDLPPSATVPPTLHEFTAEHAAILAMLEETARLGHVPADSLIGRLFACHCDSLAQDRRQLVALEQELEGHLARLDARFPVPQPEPEKPVPVRGRKFGPISRDLRATVPGTDTKQ